VGDPGRLDWAVSVMAALPFQQPLPPESTGEGPDVDLAQRVGILEEAVKLLMERQDGLQESLKTLAQQNEVLRLQLAARAHGDSVMSYLERQ